MKAARSLAVVALVASACSPLSRKEGSLEVFVADEESAAFDELVIEVRDGDDRLARDPVPASSFSGSFRFESAPAGTFSVKVYARSGVAIVLEAPSKDVVVQDGGTTGTWVRVNVDPGEDDDGDLVRNGEDACPLLPDAPPDDGDGDGTADACDNCPDVSNPSQSDADMDGTGDACESGSIQYGAVADLFSSRCALAACHSSLAPQAGLNLTAAAGYAELVNVPSSQQPGVDRVEPADVSASYLHRKVTGDASITGDSMPPAPLAPLSPGELDLVERWIEDGALP